MTPHKHHDVIVAWAKGATIQFKSRGDWVTYKEGDQGPSWYPTMEYRVKPAPVPDKVILGVCFVNWTEAQVKAWEKVQPAGHAVKMTIKTDENGKQTKTVEILE